MKRDVYAEAERRGIPIVEMLAEFAAEEVQEHLATLAAIQETELPPISEPPYERIAEIAEKLLNAASAAIVLKQEAPTPAAG